ncbi:MAG: hypothetical protein WAU64_01265, partial [Methanoregula sp.]|uniref:hypothetical protein n=1 Tax=Methanoregula sp. TaxID=2052170 RepID=UPI003BAF02FD
NQLLNFVSDSVIVLDSDLKIVSLNKNLLERLGEKRDSLIGKKPVLYTPPQTWKRPGTGFFPGRPVLGRGIKITTTRTLFTCAPQLLPTWR